MKKLFKNKKGFTLMEMLIVVAIIVILVAVSMPVFSSQLTKAKDAANEANERAARAVAVAEYLNPDGAKTGTFNYDAVNGKLEATSVTVEGYGKKTDDVNEGAYIEVTINETTGAVSTFWKGGTAD